jgi:hypothetical protein
MKCEQTHIANDGGVGIFYKYLKDAKERQIVCGLYLIRRLVETQISSCYIGR